MIDLVNMNDELFRDCLVILIKSEALGKDHAGTKGFVGWANLVKAFFKKGYPKLSNVDAMDMVLGFAVFIMTNSGSEYDFEVECDFDFTLIGHSWDKFREHLAGAYEPL